MSRVFTVLIALLALPVMASASSVDYIWFSHVTASNPAVVPVAPYGPGKILIYDFDFDTTTTVHVAMNITSDTGAISGWEVSLLTPADVAFTNGTPQGINYDPSATGGPDGSNAFGVGRGTPASGGSTGIVYSFDIVIPPHTPPFGIFGDFGITGITKSNAQKWFGFVGANPFSFAGGPGYSGVEYGDLTPGWGDLPVIIFLPEPASIAFLAVASLLVLRRRRTARL